MIIFIPTHYAILVTYIPYFISPIHGHFVFKNIGPYVQATSATPMAPLFDDYECMVEEHLNDNAPLPQSVLTNNDKY
jgi:hypothetical protein